MPRRNSRESSPTPFEGPAQRRRLEEALRDAQASSPQRSSEDITGRMAMPNGPTLTTGFRDTPLELFRQELLEAQGLLNHQPQRNFQLPPVRIDPSQIPASYAPPRNAAWQFMSQTAPAAVATAPTAVPRAAAPIPQALPTRSIRPPPFRQPVAVSNVVELQNVHPVTRRASPSAGIAGTAAAFRQTITDTQSRAVAELSRRARPSTSPSPEDRAAAGPSRPIGTSIAPLRQSESSLRVSTVERSPPSPVPRYLMAATSRSPPDHLTRGPRNTGNYPGSPIAADHSHAAGPSSGAGPAGRTPSSSAGPSRPGPSSAAGPSRGQPLSTSREVRLGLEAEFYLAAKTPDHNSSDLKEFVKILAANHNAAINFQHQRMHDNLQAPTDDHEFKTWGMVFEGSIAQFRPPCKLLIPEGSSLLPARVATNKIPGGIELRSPKLSVSPSSQWRNDVEGVWKYISTNYDLTTDENCATHIHISLVPNYTFTEIKCIACSVIYFERAIEALMPPHRRGNRFAMSNYLASPYLRREGKSRQDSIELIEMARDELEVFRFIQGYDNKNFAWNFRNLVQGNKGTIEFRQPPASSTSAQSLSWAEFVMNFIQSSVKLGSFTNLKTFPDNIRGLRSFLEHDGVRDRQLNQPVRLGKIWERKPPDKKTEPKPIPEHYLNLQEQDILTRAEEERMRTQRLFHNYVLPSPHIGYNNYWKSM